MLPGIGRQTDRRFADIRWGVGTACLMVTLAFVIIMLESIIMGTLGMWLSVILANSVTGLAAIIILVRRHGLGNLGIRALDRKGAWWLAGGCLFILVRYAVLTRFFYFISYSANGVPVSVAWIAMVLLAPTIEEVAFRGVVLNGLGGRLGPFLAIPLCSVAFTAIHLPSGSQWLAMLSGALVFDVEYYFSGNLWVPLITHALANAIQFRIVP